MENKILNNYLFYLQDKKGRRKNTIDSYRVTLNQLYAYFLKENVNEQQMLNMIKHPDLSAYINTLKNKYKIGTVNNKIGCYESFWNYLYTENIVDKDITSDMHTIPVQMTEEEELMLLNTNGTIQKKDVLSRQELWQVINATYKRNKGERMSALAGARIRFILSLTATTGMRSAEFLNMKFSWLVPVSGEKFSYDKINEEKKGFMLNIPSMFCKNKLPKRVPITGKVLKFFWEYLDERKKICGAEMPYIIISNNGEQYDRGNLNNYLEKTLKKAQISKHITTHCGRKYYASESKAIGIPDSLIHRIGGWQMNGVIDKTYCYDPRLDSAKIQACESLI